MSGQRIRIYLKHNEGWIHSWFILTLFGFELHHHCLAFLMLGFGLHPESNSSTLPCFELFWSRPLCCSLEGHSLTTSGRSAFILSTT